MFVPESIVKHSNCSNCLLFTLIAAIEQLQLRAIKSVFYLYDEIGKCGQF